MKLQENVFLCDKSLEVLFILKIVGKDHIRLKILLFWTQGSRSEFALHILYRNLVDSEIAVYFLGISTPTNYRFLPSLKSCFRIGTIPVSANVKYSRFRCSVWLGMGVGMLTSRSPYFLHCLLFLLHYPITKFGRIAPLERPPVLTGALQQFQL